MANVCVNELMESFFESAQQCLQSVSVVDGLPFSPSNHAFYTASTCLSGVEGQAA